MKRFETTRTRIILVQNSKISLYFIVFIWRSSKRWKYIFFVHLNDFCDIALAYTIFRFCAIYAPKGF